MVNKINPLDVKISSTTENNIQVYTMLLQDIIRLSAEESLQYVKKKDSCLQATINERPVGFLSYFREEKNNLYTDDFDVFPEYQRNGIGSLMLLELERIAKSLNISHINLHVLDNNIQAINFYNKNHFVNSKLIKNFLLNNSNAYLFIKHLK